MKRKKLKAGLGLTLIIIVITYLIVGNPSIDLFQEEMTVSDTVTILEDLPPPIPRIYGIPIDSFNIEEDRIPRNQSLGVILARYGISPVQIDLLAKKSMDVFDPRKIRAGNIYKAFTSKDTLHKLAYFVYEHTPVEYVLFDLTSDTGKVSLHEKEVITKRKKAKGTVNTSLWNSMVENGINPVVAIELSEIYAWSIDFFGLQKGDSFAVVYDEIYVDTFSVGLGKIQSAVFTHANENFYAIPFVQDSTESFFDLEGNSLRKAFLKAPLRFSRISSRYSNSRLHPVLKIRRPHHGVDYAAPTGTPVMAVGDGKVISQGWSGGAGRMVKIRHNSVYTTAYLHLSRYGKGVSTGKYVKQGDIIGYVGSSGLSTGPHLDFRFYRNGHPVDPLSVEAPPVEPVHAENKTRFDSTRIEWLAELSELHPHAKWMYAQHSDSVSLKLIPEKSASSTGSAAASGFLP